MNRNDIARARAQDQADILEDLLASVEKIGVALRYSLLDLRRDGGPALPIRLRAKRQADRLHSLADTIERAIKEPVAVDLDPDDPLPLRTVEHA